MAYRLEVAHDDLSGPRWDHLFLRAGSEPHIDRLVKFNDEERQQARDLLSRAMLLGESEEIWTASAATFQAKRQEFMENKQWDTVCAEFRRRRDLRAAAATQTAGAMSDGSKRARPSSPTAPVGLPDPSFPAGPPPPTRTTSMAPLRRGGAKSGPAVPGSPATSVSGTGTRHQLDGIVISPSELPDGVSSVVHWSRTPINFGKLKSRSLTYYDLAVSKTEQDLSYKEWIMARVQSGGDQLRDLARFLKLLKDSHMLPTKHGSTSTSSCSPAVIRAPLEEEDLRADTPTSQLGSVANGWPTPSP